MAIVKDDLKNLGIVEILALTLYGEARGESISGQCAVGNVIRNRVIKSGKGWHDIILAKWQFSCWNENDPNFIPLMEMAEKILLEGNSPDEIRMQIWIAMGIIGGDVRDESDGAVNYMTSALFYSNNAPSWARDMRNTKVIGRHIFGSA